MALPFEREYPWEAARGSALDRTLAVHAEAQRVYAQQAALLPALQLERAPDPEAAERVRDLGRRTRVLREHEAQSKRGWRPGDSPLKGRGGSPKKRVVPSRFPEEADAGGYAEDADLGGRIETMLMDQEWDTRGWTRPKIHAAIDALYNEVEDGEDPKRRQLATTMIIRLLEVHEDAVDFVETTIPTLSNKAFRTLAKAADNQRTFRVANLLGILAQWFARVLSAENAVGKSVGHILRETELCARIVQHHWRGVRFERSLHRREYDPAVRARVRSMHLVKFVELRHQFKVFRQVIGRGGLPVDAVHAYVSIIYRLVQNDPRDVDAPHSSSPSATPSTPNYVLANQRKLVSAGALAFLASLITAQQRTEITALVISIVRETAVGQGPAKIVDVLQSNIVERVTADIKRLQLRSDGDDAAMDAALDLLRVLSDQVLAGLDHFSHSKASSTSEDAFMLGNLTRQAATFLPNSETIDGLFQVLHASNSPLQRLEARCSTALTTICYMTRLPFGFPQVLDHLTRNGGRHMELVLQCLLDPRPTVVADAMALYCEVTDHPHGRQGLTTAGAVKTFMRWCQTGDQLVMGLIGCSLIARQTLESEKAAQSWLLPAIQSSNGRLDALYKLLLALVAKEGDGSAERSAAFFLDTNSLSTLVKFLAQVTPTNMEPATQSPRHRNVSCIVLSRFFRLPQVASTCFSEDVVNHLALSLQCNRLDEVEKIVARYSPELKLIHRLGSKEACAALSRLSRCSSRSTTSHSRVVAQLRPSVTSSQVPELPQALVCDVMVRLHVLEDLVAYIKPVDSSADSPDVETALTTSAIELAGLLRPLPFGEAARVKFFKMFALHDHGKYAIAKLLLLAEVVAPSILRVLREPNLDAGLVSACCSALSRLACTNAACSALLAQGSLQTALMHLPEFLFDPTRGTKSKKSASEWVIDSKTDEHGLLDVPAALYTLLGKLCAVSEGRAGLMRAQVLPRVLKRLQLTDKAGNSSDLDCKSEIAVVLSRLAMVSTAEGNASELFVHFGVLELLMKLLKAQLHHTNRHSTTSGLQSPSTKETTQWKVVDHVLGAIAAMSMDLLVCVPKLVDLGVLRLLSPFLDRQDDCGQSRSVRFDSIQLHAVRIVHSIAMYPFGAYHSLLESIKASEARSDSASKRGRSIEPFVSTLMEQVKRIGFDFAAELRGREATAAIDAKTVGDLAREALAAMNEAKAVNQRAQQPSRSVSSLSQGQQHESSGSSRAVGPQRPPSAAFPALSSPSSGSKAAGSDQRPSGRVTKEHPTKALPSTTGSSSSPVVRLHPTSPVKLNGVDLATTRPPGKHTQQQSTGSSSSSLSPQFIFATPTPKPRSSARDAAISSLMLDPLFDSSPLPSHHHNHIHHPHTENNSDAESFVFLQETDRCGHLVTVKGRRTRRGDKYVPSLGLLSVDAAAPRSAFHPCSKAIRQEPSSSPS